MKEICKLAAEKGFKAKTFSTGWTLDFHLDKGKDILITPTAEYILLCEIQKWIRDEFEIFIFVAPVLPDLEEYGCDIYSKNQNYLDTSWAHSYEEALKAGIKETLKII